MFRRVRRVHCACLRQCTMMANGTADGVGGGRSRRSLVLSLNECATVLGRKRETLSGRWGRVRARWTVRWGDM